MEPITKEECEVLHRQYHRLLTQGYHPKAARRIVCQAAYRVVSRRTDGAGMGQGDPGTIIRQAADIEPIKKARETVTPWLWVLSIAGFIMTALNTRRIAKMFKGWKSKQKAKAS